MSGPLDNIDTAWRHINDRIAEGVEQFERALTQSCATHAKPVGEPCDKRVGRRYVCATRMDTAITTEQRAWREIVEALKAQHGEAVRRLIEQGYYDAAVALVVCKRSGDGGT